jgi:hypothetical protein
MLSFDAFFVLSLNLSGPMMAESSASHSATSAVLPNVVAPQRRRGALTKPLAIQLYFLGRRHCLQTLRLSPKDAPRWDSQKNAMGLTRRKGGTGSEPAPLVNLECVLMDLGYETAKVVPAFLLFVFLFLSASSIFLRKLRGRMSVHTSLM